MKHQEFPFAFTASVGAYFQLDKQTVYAAHGKRMVDIILAIIISPIVVTVIAVLWLMIRAGGGPGCFAHERVGQHGRVFKCWKLRTMHTGSSDEFDAYLANNSEAAAEWDKNHKLQQDDRVTRLGRILRRTSLDELPQIWNVLIGDMSFVGPRPIVKAELMRYGARKSHYLALRPGITGLWQVSGRNSVSYAKRVSLDVKYQKRQSPILDLKILFLTFAVVLDGDGV